MNGFSGSHNGYNHCLGYENMSFSVFGPGTPSSVTKGIDELVKNQWGGGLALGISIIAILKAFEII